MLWNRISREKLLKVNQSSRKLKKHSKRRVLAIDTKLKRNISTRRRLLANNRKPKRKSSHIAKNFSQVKKKRKIGEVMRTDGVVDITDRISELPEHVIHKILCLLRSKEAARTSVLSKRWRSAWNSLLTFDFDQRSFQSGDEGKGKFINFVENSLAARLEPLFCIQKFRLYITSFDNLLASRMNSWVGAAINKNVRDLEIHVVVKKRRCYILPPIVLMAKTVSSLKLCGCSLDNYSDINLPNIKELSIRHVRVEVDVINFIISSCPLIEDLRLVFCEGLKSLQISTLSKLNRIEVHECDGLKSVEIKLPNLQIFWFHAKRSRRQCKINLKGCEGLKMLTLKDTYMTDELFQTQISQFPVLEKLVLKECNELKRIAIFSGKLKALVLLRCQNLWEAIIDAPNLFSFEYTGHLMPFSSMNISSLTEAKLCFGSDRKIKPRVAYDVQKFLAKFDQSKGLKLVACADKSVAIYEDIGILQFLSLNYLKLEITKSSLQVKEHFDSMLRNTFPMNLFIVSSPNSELLKFVQEKVKGRGETDLSCCRYYTRKCWRHYLQRVETEVMGGSSVAYNPCPPSSSSSVTTLFKFDWSSTTLSYINCDTTMDQIMSSLPALKVGI